jgi:hypothetical protein
MGQAVIDSLELFEFLPRIVLLDVTDGGQTVKYCHRWKKKRKNLSGRVLSSF